MRIYDCFSFYNEFDLLELRFKELYDHVDFFVIVESDRTYTCRPKPYLFEQHGSRYQQWSDKIRYIKHVSQADPDPWVNEHAQRCAILAGIEDADSEDLIIVSDADEIIRSSCLMDVRANPQATFYGFYMPLFNFKFNYMRTDPEPYNIIAIGGKAHWIRRFSPRILRHQKDNLLIPNHEIKFQKRRYAPTDTYILKPEEIKIIPHGGWHFSYLGDNNLLREKAMSTSHQEDITPEFLQQLDVEKSIREKKCWNRYWPYKYEIVDLSDYFPRSCLDYPQHCLANSGIDALNLLSVHAA